MSPGTAASTSVLHERRKFCRRHEDKRSQQRERELEAVRHTREALFQHVDPDKLVEQALQTAMDIVDAEAGSVLLADPETQELVFAHSIGIKAVRIGMRMPWHEGLAGAVFRTGQPEIIYDARMDTRHFHTLDRLTGYESRDMIVFALKRWEGEPIGVLEGLNKRAGRLA